MQVGGPKRQLLLQRAAEMRRNPAEPERRMWMELRDSRFFGFKFRRQVVMGWRIVDFFCPAKGLVVEIDGDTHEVERDLASDVRLRRGSGFDVVRFTNPDVMQNLDGVLIALKIALERRPERWLKRREHHPPTPSSVEEGETMERRFKAPTSSEEGVGGGGGPR
jgi:very-short-patch-repair endonuclease